MEMTEEQVRKIAREEAIKAQKKLFKEISEIKIATAENKKILDRLYRLLLGELGVKEDDTLKARAEFAYNYAKRNSDFKVVERVTPVIEWFERMNEPEPGEKESDMARLGKLIGLYEKVGWLLGLIGVTTLITALPVIVQIIEWIRSVI